MLRPVAVVAKIGNAGTLIINAVYPDPATALPPGVAAQPMRLAVPGRTVEHLVASGVVLEREARLLDRAIEAHYSEPKELALARLPDLQGMGGSSSVRLTRPG